MIWTILGVLLLLWLLGIGLKIGGKLIHLLLIIAIIVFVVRTLS